MGFRGLGALHVSHEGELEMLEPRRPSRPPRVPRCRRRGRVGRCLSTSKRDSIHEIATDTSKHQHSYSLAPGEILQRHQQNTRNNSKICPYNLTTLQSQVRTTNPLNSKNSYVVCFWARKLFYWPWTQEASERADVPGRQGEAF